MRDTIIPVIMIIPKPERARKRLTEPRSSLYYNHERKISLVILENDFDFLSRFLFRFDVGTRAYVLFNIFAILMHTKICDDPASTRTHTYTPTFKHLFPPGYTVYIMYRLRVTCLANVRRSSRRVKNDE